MYTNLRWKRNANPNSIDCETATRCRQAMYWRERTKKVMWITKVNFKNEILNVHNVVQFLIGDYEP